MRIVLPVVLPSLVLPLIPLLPLLAKSPNLLDILRDVGGHI